MIHYKDMTFCSANCLNTDCFRNQQWVPHPVPYGLPVAWCDFSPECSRYEPMKDKPQGDSMS